MNELADIERQIERLAGRGAAHKLDGAQILSMRRPCVYVWVRADEVLYVGKGSGGIRRPLSTDHHRLRNDVIQDTDALLVYECQPGEEDLLEQFLISKLKPTQNGTRTFVPDSDAIRGFLNRKTEPPDLATTVLRLEQSKAKLAEARKRTADISHQHALLQRRFSERPVVIKPVPEPETWPQVEMYDYGPVRVVDELEFYHGAVGFYDDDELTEEGGEYIDEHLEACAKCQAEEECGELSDLENLFAGAIVVLQDARYIIVPLDSLRAIPETHLPAWLRLDDDEAVGEDADV